jgi:hypothetical protein
MIRRKFLSAALVAFVACSMCSRAALAATPPEKKETARRSEQIQATVSKLVRDAKDERKTLLIAVPQAPTNRGNNLSKGTKIAIGVGIAAAIVVIIFVAISPALNDGR